MTIEGESDHAAPMRTGILTLHYGFNEGAILQAFALTELLRSCVGGRVEIVDQRYPSKMTVYGDAAKSCRTQVLARAIDEWLPLGPERLRRAESTDLIRELGVEYDRLVFGSDVLWSLHYRRRLGILPVALWPKQDHPFFPAYPNVYWPSADQPCSKIVFAASIGSFDWRALPTQHVRGIREGLESCCAISVRDEWTREFVSSLSSELADRVLQLADPTLSRPFRARADLDREDPALQSRLASLGVDFGRPRCLVISACGAASDRVVGKLEDQGMQTVAVTTPNDRCALDLADEGFEPMDWARLFRFFDVCVTERMHGAIFSLICGTPFLAIDMNDPLGEGETKMRSFLRRFGIEEVLVGHGQSDPVLLGRALVHTRERAWDWDYIRKQIEVAADQQAAFVGSSVSAIQETSAASCG